MVRKATLAPLAAICSARHASAGEYVPFQVFHVGPAQVSVLEMDGAFDKLEELIYVESHLSNTSGRFYGEVTQQMLKNSSFPGSTNGTGLFQTICGLKIREVYERITQNTVMPVVG